MARRTQGIETRQGKQGPQYRGTAYDPARKRKLRGPWTGSLAEAKAWRVDALAAVHAGTRSASDETVRQVASRWLELATAGHARTRQGAPYKPSVIRAYGDSLRVHVYPDLGSTPIGDVTQPLLVRLLERWQLEGKTASVIRNAITALRVVLRWATARGELHANPVAGLALPSPPGRRERVADASEAERLLQALPAFERAVYATALYAGLRRGELAGLRWSDVDLAGGVLRVERSYDFVSHEMVAPKSVAGVRVVPIAGRLREILIEHGLETRASGDDPVFGMFNPRTVANRADEAFASAGLLRITLHECRHSYASISIAAGVEPKQLQTAMGHSSIAITLDRYGHLFPASVEDFRGKLDEYLG